MFLHTNENFVMNQHQEIATQRVQSSTSQSGCLRPAANPQALSNSRAKAKNLLEEVLQVQEILVQDEM